MSITKVVVTVNFGEIAKLPGTQKGNRVVVNNGVDPFIEYSTGNISVNDGDTLAFGEISASASDPQLSNVSWDSSDFSNSAQGSLIYNPTGSSDSLIEFTANNKGQQTIDDNLTMAINFTYGGENFTAIWDPEVKVGGGL